MKKTDWGMLFVLKNEKTEEKFIDICKDVGIKLFKEKNRRDKIAYSIIKLKGKTKEDKRITFDNFLEKLKNHTEVTAKMTKKQIIIMKVESV